MAPNKVVVVTAVMAIGALAMSVVQPILPLYLDAIGIPAEILGLMFSTAMAAMAFGESYWGWMADRVGFWLPLTVGTIVCGLTVLLFLLTDTVWLLFVIFFFWGLFRSAVFGPGRGIIGANAPPMKKSTYMAMAAAIIAASRSLGALPSGFIADAWGHSSVFLVSAGITFVGGAIVLVGFGKSVGKSRRVAVEGSSPVGSDCPSPDDTPLDLRPYRTQCSVTAFQFFGWGVSIAFLPLLASRLGATAAEVGILFTAMALTTMLLSIPMGMLADKQPKETMMIVGLLIGASAMAGMAFADRFSLLLTSVVFSSLGLSLFSPAALGLLSNSVPPHRQSTAMGLYGGVCENTGIILGSAIAGFVWSAWGPQATFLMGTFTSAAGAAMTYFFLRSGPVRNRGIPPGA